MKRIVVALVSSVVVCLCGSASGTENEPLVQKAEHLRSVCCCCCKCASFSELFSMFLKQNELNSRVSKLEEGRLRSVPSLVGSINGSDVPPSAEQPEVLVMGAEATSPQTLTMNEMSDRVAALERSFTDFKQGLDVALAEFRGSLGDLNDRISTMFERISTAEELMTKFRNSYNNFVPAVRALLSYHRGEQAFDAEVKKETERREAQKKLN